MPRSFDRRAFFDACRKGVMGPVLDPDEVSGAGAILDAMWGCPIAWTAYALATAWHETAHEMQPIAERGGAAYFTRLYDIRGQRPELAREMGNTAPGDGALYRGRGYVQLTWKANYARAAQKTGYPLVGNPDLALRRDIAATVMRQGMEEGWFTGKALAHFLPRSGAATHRQLFDARRTVNGRDRAGLIADYAQGFQDALYQASWTP